MKLALKPSRFFHTRAQPRSRPDTAPSHLRPVFSPAGSSLKVFFPTPARKLVTDRPHPRSRGPAFRRPCADRSDLAILRPAGDPCPAPRRPGEVLRRPLPSHPCAAGSRDSLRRRLPSRLRRRFPRCSSSPARSAPPPLAPCPSCSSPRLKPWILPQF